MKKNNLKKNIIPSALILAAIIGLSGLSGCVTTSEMDNLRLEVRQTRSQLSKSIENLDEKINQADSSIREEIQTSSTPVQTRQANLWAEVNALKIDVAELQGTIDSLTLKIEEINGGDSNSTISLRELSSEFNQMRLALESQLDMNLDKIQPHNAAKQPAAVSATISQSTGIEAVLADSAKDVKPADPAQALYNRALGAFRDREYKKAIADWSEFTKTFPDNSLVPNAVFWEGESYYQLKNYPNAALKYQVIIGKYSKSNKYKSAMLKQGLSLIKLGKTKSGKYILEDLVKKSPDSIEGKRAKKYLQDIK